MQSKKKSEQKENLPAGMFHPDRESFQCLHANFYSTASPIVSASLRMAASGSLLYFKTSSFFHFCSKSQFATLKSPAPLLQVFGSLQNLRLHKPASFIIKQFYRPAPYAADG